MSHDMRANMCHVPPETIVTYVCNLAFDCSIFCERRKLLKSKAVNDY